MSGAHRSSIDTESIDVSASLDFVAGWVAGVASLAVGYPFDTVKVRLQHAETSGKYTGLSHALRTIVREERFVGLYKGVASPLFGVAFMNATLFASYGWALRFQSAKDVPTLAQVAWAGTASGIATGVVTAPIERIKILQQADTRTAHTPSTIALVRSLGIRGVFVGLGPTIIRDGPGYATYFLAYEGTKRWLNGEGQGSWTATLIAGGVAGCVGWATTYPFDTIKTRYQSMIPLPAVATASTPLLPPPTAPHASPSIIRIARDIYTTNGVRGFFRGFTTTQIRAFIVNSVTFFSYEMIVSAQSSAWYSV